HRPSPAPPIVEALRTPLGGGLKADQLGEYLLDERIERRGERPVDVGVIAEVEDVRPPLLATVARAFVAFCNSSFEIIQVPATRTALERDELGCRCGWNRRRRDARCFPRNTLRALAELMLPLR